MALQSLVNKTLIYSDIFDYPLTFPQIYKYLITAKKTEYRKVLKMVDRSSFEKRENYFFLKGRSKIVSLREKREIESVKKIALAEKVVRKLKFVPGIKLVGISGSVAMKNADKNADIDLFVISKKGSGWTTRLFLVCFLSLMGIYRKKNDKKSSNKFCLNMIIDEGHMLFPKDRRDIYTAHEIAQLLPLFQKGNTYQKFIKKNEWIYKYLANYEPYKLLNNDRIILKRQLGFGLFEKAAKFVQVKYMGEIQGKEQVSEGFMAFHPTDPRNDIVSTYNARLRRYFPKTLGH